jgi:hypothetical protein
LLFSKLNSKLNDIQDWEEDEASIDSDSQSSASSEEESKGAESGGSDAEQEIEGDFEWVFSSLSFFADWNIECL